MCFSLRGEGKYLWSNPHANDVILQLNKHPSSNMLITTAHHDSLSHTITGVSVLLSPDRDRTEQTLWTSYLQTGTGQSKCYGTLLLRKIACLLHDAHSEAGTHETWNEM